MTRRRKKHRPPETPHPERPEQTVSGAVDRLTSGFASDVRRLYSVPAICGFLLLAVIAVFGQTAGHEFIICDDNQYVYENPYVLPGVTWDGIRWAFTKSWSANWHPLTWISHMLDCQWSPLASGDAYQKAPLHHITNVALHAVAAVLLLLALQSLTGRLWPSAFVAAVFAVHPLRVESVAWVAERKDVLSGVFFMATLWAYAAYVRRGDWPRYLLVLLLFALGLMAKPMLVTLPCVLLLLDYWPLRRLGRGRQMGGPPVGKVVLEKVPMFFLAAVSCGLTIWAQAQVRAFKELPWPWRLGNAMVAYVQYIRQTFWPVGLAVYYPHEGQNLPWWQIAVSGAFLAAITTAAIFSARKRGYFLVGWLMFLGMLVPVIGLLQVGAQARADRYMYLPQIGLAIAAAWGVADLTKRWPVQKLICGGLSAAVLAALAALSFRQTAIWRTNETLWRHAIQCTDKNDYAYTNLGMTLVAAGKNDEAIECYRKAIEFNPSYGLPHDNLGTRLYAQGKIDAAAEEYALAVLADPHSAKAHNNLGVMLYTKKMIPQAVDQFEQALKEDSQYALALRNLARIFIEEGKFDEGIAYCHSALEINPRFADAHHDLGLAFEKLG
ncbi:MAG: tetratricopeptide repeat protein, partial [Thermoguttaceae bacterium]